MRTSVPTSKPPTYPTHVGSMFSAKLTELLKSRGERLRSVQNLVRCNQMPIDDFALEYGFSEVAQYLGAEKNEPVLAVLGQ